MASAIIERWKASAW